MSLDEPMKICRNCKHHKGRDYIVAEFDACAALTSIDIVTGETKYKLCSYARSDRGECGPDGRLFVECNE